ncbi:MAG: cellulose biosynthesis protein BcsN [Pseudomonadota bacterium]
MIRPSDAYILPDPGGAVVIGAVQRNLGSAVQHEVLLAGSNRTPGENALTVDVFGGSYRRGEGGLASEAPSPDAITREMQAVLPGVDMQISPYYVQNRYGPFGYAVGRGNGRDLCLYGWQRLQTTSSAGTLLANRFLMQVRLRMCEAGGDERELLRSMYSYSLASYFGTQYADVPAAPTKQTFRRLDSPDEIRPSNPTGLALVLPKQTPAAAPQAVARRPAAPAAAQPAREATAPAPAQAAPIVPAPTTTVRSAATPVPQNVPVATAPRPSSGAAGPLVPPPSFVGQNTQPSAASEVPLGSPTIPDPMSPAMIAITAAREIKLPQSLAREVSE